jgi:valyl-tRNA synthetase
MNQYRGRIREQTMILGASCDWTRFAFTMDPGPSRAVRHVFKQLYDKGLIYRGERLISWCPRCQTALSDLEVVHRDESGSLWTIAYPIEGSDEVITVARPDRRRCLAIPASPFIPLMTATGISSENRLGCRSSTA